MKMLYSMAIGVAIVALGFGACKSSKNVSTGQKVNTNWAGMYRGTTTIDGNRKVVLVNLANDQTYIMSEAFVSDYNNVKETRGELSWDKSGNEVTLKNAGDHGNITFFVSPNALSEKKKENNQDYALVLTKIPNEGIKDMYWKLIELNGEQVELNRKLRREPFILLRSNDNRMAGTGGCNKFMGTYSISNNNMIKFSPMATTKMACEHMEVEDQMLKMLQEADNYTISSDGKYLSLNRARMAPLARFEIMYLRDIE